MASEQKDDSVGKRIRKEMRDMRKKYKEQGYDDMEIESLMRDFFVQKAPAKKASTMTAAKGGVAKKRMSRGGAVKKRMAYGGAAKKAAPKRMALGGAAKK